jgi:hypothetical protein
MPGGETNSSPDGCITALVVFLLLFVGLPIIGWALNPHFSDRSADQAVYVMEHADERALADPSFDGHVPLNRQGYAELVRRLALPTPYNVSLQPMAADDAAEYIHDNEARDDEHALRVVSLPFNCQISSYYLQNKSHK